MPKVAKRKTKAKTRQAAEPKPKLPSAWVTLYKHEGAEPDCQCGKCVRERYADSCARFILAAAARQSGKCLARGTLITLPDGRLLPVEEIKAGEKVVSLNEKTYKLEERKVVAVHSNGIKPTVFLRTSGQVLKCTANHRLLSSNYKWVEAGSLKPGDFVAVPKKVGRFGTQRMDENELDFLSIWLAEGSHYTVSNETPEIVEIVHRIAKHWELGIKTWNGPDMYLVYGKARSTSEIRHPVRLFLNRFGLWDKDSHTKFIPDCVFHLPRKQLARFLSLFVACDGCISESNVHSTPRAGYLKYQLEIALASEYMLRQLISLFLKFGIRGVYRHRVASCDGNHFAVYDFAASSHEALLRFSSEIGAVGKEVAVERAYTRSVMGVANGNGIVRLPISFNDFLSHLQYTPVKRKQRVGARYEDAPVELLSGLKHWSEQATKTTTLKTFKRLQHYTDGYYDRMIDGDVAWEKVVSVKKWATVPTYDLTVQGNHNFIADGIVTHNSEQAKRRIVGWLPVQKPWSNPRYFYAAPTYQQVKDIAWDDFKRLVPKEWVAPNGISESILCIKTKFGSQIRLFGLDRPHRMEGFPGGWDGGVVDEASDIPGSVFTLNILPQLTWRNGWCYRIGVPKRVGVGAAEFRDNCIKAAKGELPHTEAYAWSSEGILPPDQLITAQGEMSQRDYDEQFRGIWQDAGGGVFYAFDAEFNVRPCIYRPDMPILVGSDFNVDPMAWTLCHCYDGVRLEVFDEIWLQNTNTQHTLDVLFGRYSNHKGGFEFYGDATGKARKTSASMSDYFQIVNDERFKLLGRTIHYIQANPGVHDRFAACNTLLCNAKQERHCHIDPRCKHLISDLQARMFMPGTNQLPNDEGAIGHISDSWGYLCYKRFPIRIRMESAPEIIIQPSRH